MKYLIFSFILLLFWVTLVQGQTVNGVVTLSATATDVTAAVGDTECGIASVQFFNGATALGPALTTPNSGNNYTLPLDTKTLSNGTYTIIAKATDKAGSNVGGNATICDGSKPNIGVSNALTLVINNQAPDIAAPTINITIIISVP